MSVILRVLLLEDSEKDAKQILDELEKGGYIVTSERVDTLILMTAELEQKTWDLVLADYSASRYSALDALTIFGETGLDIPFIVIAKQEDEQLAVEAMQKGAQDYVIKDNLVRLLPAVQRELRETEIRAAHRRADETIRYQAYHDALTRLPNRALFIDRLQQTILAADRKTVNVSLMLLDLNNFKGANDTLGHHAGDILLQQLASRLRASVRQSDTVARMDGVEFAILVNGIDHHKTLSAARKILDMVEKPYLVNVNQFVLSASMGIAFFPENGTTVDTLIRHADTALQAAKENQGGFVLYRTDQKQKSGKKIALTSELYQAIANDELTLNFQPKVDFKTAEIYGVETLVRWNHSEYGFVSPEEFIPLAEQTEVIQDLTLWVLKNALEQHRRWSEQGIHLKMAVNLSIKNLMDPSCHCKILKLIDDFNVEPNVLELELTETTMMSDPAAALRKMEQLTERGINFSVDDFGTGYSSLSYLKRLPVKVLKVDKSFLQDIIRDEHDAVIVRATIDLAHNLGLKIVAEGIEDRATWDLLQILRCDMAQGYYVSRPLLAENLVAWMENYDEFKCEHALS